MKQLSSQEKTKEACIEWSSNYISVFEEVAKSPIADFNQLGVFSWSDQFIWCSTHCQINLNIKDEGFHTFAQAQESSFLSVYTLLIQHTFQILESFDISAPEAAFHIPNFFERHFDYISLGIASQSSGWTDEEKDTFKTAFEIDQRWIVELGADRTPHISQAQSINVFVPADIHKKELHDIHFQAWKKGLKSLYYCRSKSIQRAENVEAGSSTDVTKNVYSKSNESNNKDNNYEECLSCQ